MGLCLSTSASYLEEAQESMKKGWELMDAGDAESALACFETVISLTPKSDIAYLYEGLCLRSLGRAEDAIRSYKMALKWNHYNLRAEYSLAYVQNLLKNDSQGQDKETILPAFQNVIDKILKSNAYTFDDYIAKANAYDDIKNHSNQAAMLEEALKFRIVGSIYSSLGSIYLDLQNFEGAERAYMGVLKQVPNDTTALNNLSYIGKKYLDLQSFESAERAYTEILNHNPKDASAWNNLSYVQGKLGKFDESIEAAQESLKFRPNDAQTYCNLAASYEDKQDFDQALKNYQLSIKYDSKNPLSHSGLGHSLFKRNQPGDEKEALFYLNKAFELYQDPNNHKNFKEEHHVGLTSVFSNERQALLDKLNTLAKTEIELVKAEETSASKAKLDEHNKQVVKLEDEKKEVAAQAFEILGPQSTASAAEVDRVTDLIASLMDRMKNMEAETAALKQENVKLKQELTTKASSASVSAAIRSNSYLEKIHSYSQQISQDQISYRYNEALKFTINSAYVSAMAVAKGDVELNTSSLAVTGAAALSSLIPFAGGFTKTAIEFVGSTAISMKIKQNAAHFSKIASDVSSCDRLVLHLSARITLNQEKSEAIHDAAKTEIEASSWWSKVTKSLADAKDEVTKSFDKSRYQTIEEKIAHKDAMILIDGITKSIAVGEIEFPLVEEDFINKCYGILGLSEDSFGFAIEE